MSLTEVAIKAAKPSDKARKLYDTEGLYLEVAPSGGKWWRFKYRVNGKEKRISLGTYPKVSLLQARKARDEVKRMLADGVDPSQARQQKKSAALIAASNSFESVARSWFKGWAKTRSPKHAAKTMRRLEVDVFPQIGRLPIATIKSAQIVALAKLVESRGANDLARRAIQISGQVLRYAVGHELTEYNPVSNIRPSDVLTPLRRTNYARVPLSCLPQLLRDIDDYRGHIRTRIAMQLMALTFVRTGELIRARWDEFDLKAARWQIPAEVMKMRDPHIVPLSRQALALLDFLRQTGTSDVLLFPGKNDHEKAISNNTILQALARMGYKGRMTGHGFRGIASTALHEMGFEHAHIEMQLAHQERDETSAAYNYATYLPQRTAMMQHWADHLDSLRSA
jgi:integrase